jgi:hypothetical protein
MDDRDGKWRGSRREVGVGKGGRRRKHALSMRRVRRTKDGVDTRPSSVRSSNGGQTTGDKRNVEFHRCAHGVASRLSMKRPCRYHAGTGQGVGRAGLQPALPYRVPGTEFETGVPHPCAAVPGLEVGGWNSGAGLEPSVHIAHPLHAALLWLHDEVSIGVVMHVEHAGEQGSGRWRRQAGKPEKSAEMKSDVRQRRGEKAEQRPGSKGLIIRCAMMAG